MKLTINVENAVVPDSLNVLVSVENNSGVDVCLINKQTVSASNNPAYEWNVEIYYLDSIIMISPVNFFDKRSIPTREDYHCLKHEEIYTFSFTLDFTRLVMVPSEFGNKNVDFGLYSIKLKYNDPYCNDKNALKVPLISNEVKVLYIKE